MNTSDNLKVADEVEGVEVAHEADLTELVVELFILFCPDYNCYSVFSSFARRMLFMFNYCCK